jgi:predicted nuclease of predicted toxin-antitoxin system
VSVSLLFDENLAERLVSELSDSFPGSTHVRTEGLSGDTDRSIWEYAAKQGLLLVTKDEDFHRYSVLYGPPPKVIWIRLGNCATADVARLLRFRAAEVEAFANQAELSFLALG